MTKKPPVSKKESKTLAKKLARLEKIRVDNDKSKVLGTCIVCEEKTILIRGFDLCGPCCFGEADTINGNW